MKIQVLSDLHREFNSALRERGLDDSIFKPVRTDADVVVLAGDIDYGTKSFDWAEKSFGGVPIIYVAGNHEFYNNDYQNVLRKMSIAGKDREWLRYTTILFHEGYVFLNAPLWTDYQLYGNPERSMYVAERCMADHRVIKNGDAYFTPEDALREHEIQVGFIEAWLQAARDDSTLDPDKVVVCTHHLPHPKCIDPRYSGSELNPAFTSDLSHLIDKYQPALWIHGHTHSSVDVMVGKTRIVCNPRGYVRGDGSIENPNFKPDFVVEI